MHSQVRRPSGRADRGSDLAGPGALLLALALLLCPQAASANTGVPAVIPSFWVNLLLLPLIIWIEGRVYRSSGLKHPLVLSLWLNLISSAVGVVISWPLGGALIQTPASSAHLAEKFPQIDPYRGLADSLVIVLVLVFLNLLLTLLVEWQAARLLPRHLSAGLQYRDFLRANLLSYLLVAVVAVILVARVL